MFLIIFLSFIFSTYFVKKYVSIPFYLKAIKQYYQLFNSIELKNSNIDSINYKLNQIVRFGLILFFKLFILIIPCLIIYLTTNLVNMHIISSIFISTLSYYLGMKLKK